MSSKFNYIDRNYKHTHYVYSKIYFLRTLKHNRKYQQPQRNITYVTYIVGELTWYWFNHYITVHVYTLSRIMCLCKLGNTW